MQGGSETSDLPYPQLRVPLPQRGSIAAPENQYFQWGASSLLLGEGDPHQNLDTIGLGGMHTLKKVILKQLLFLFILSCDI